MILHEIPTELKELIFTHFTPDDWINTAKVSNEWLNLTLGSIKKVESCHVLILDHLAEFINQQRHTNYNWVSLLALMPKLEHLECFENTKAFWTEISPICHQLKVLHCTPTEVECFDSNKLDISFANLVELQWDGSYEGQVFPLHWLAYSPELKKLSLTCVKINYEWRSKIPKSVNRIELDQVEFCDEDECSINDVCEDTSSVEMLVTLRCALSVRSAVQFFDKTPRLTNLELEFNKCGATTVVIENAARKCQNLKDVFAVDMAGITGSWRRLFHPNIDSIYFCSMIVDSSIRSEFSFDWLFQNYGSLQSLEVDNLSCAGFDSQKFYSTKNLKTLVLGKIRVPFEERLQQSNEAIDPYSDICVRMIRGSHLVDITLEEPIIDESWRHIFPTTVKKLKLENFRLSEEANEVFSPQFICETPSNIEFLSMEYDYGDLPGMNLNAFSLMNKLQELHLLDLSISEHCLQSILTHCSALTDLVLHELKSVALSKIPQNLVLPSLRKLKVKKAVDKPSLLLQHFPNLRKVNITIVPPDNCFADIMDVLQVAEVVELKIGGLSWHLLHSLVENIDDTKFEYFCLSVVRRKEFSFHLTNSIFNAFRKVYRFPLIVKNGVLWTKNYPTSPLLRKHVSTIPSNIGELSKRYHEIMAREEEDWFYHEDSDNYSDDEVNGDGDGDNGDNDCDSDDEECESNDISAQSIQM